MSVRLDSDAALDDLFDTVFGHHKDAARLSLEICEDGNMLSLLKQNVVALAAQSQLLFGIYSELAAARRERRGTAESASANGLGDN